MRTCDDAEQWRAEQERARREPTEGDIDVRRHVADRYRKNVQAARSEAQRLGKALADVLQRRDELEHVMRQA